MGFLPATASYTCWTNLDARYDRPYQPGDRLVRGYSGTVQVVCKPDGSDDGLATAERVYARHNRDDRPDGQLCPSMSVGDVVMFYDEVSYSVDRVGFVHVLPQQSDLIIDRTWKEMI